MFESQWVEWTRTTLPPRQREELLAAATSEQKAHLLEHDYVWVEGVGVLWNPPYDAPLRRARFTHGTYFRTRRGELYIGSEGRARVIPDHGPALPAPAPPTPSLSGSMEPHDGFRRSGGFDDVAPRPDTG